MVIGRHNAGGIDTSTELAVNFNNQKPELYPILWKIRSRRVVENFIRAGLATPLEIFFYTEPPRKFEGIIRGF